MGKISIIRFCYKCNKNTRWDEYGYSKFTERYKCNNCGSIHEYQVV